MPQEIYIAIRDGTGDGSRLDPFNGSTDATLDAILLGAGENTAIHFGPGVFRTKGLGGSQSIVTVRSGQRWIGSGINATFLQLVKAAPPTLTPATPTAVVIIGSIAPLDGFQISDMTLDVNLARQPKQGDAILGWKNAPIKADAVGLAGKNITVQRVRVINWGTYTDAHEGFPVYLNGWPPGAFGTNIIEECIIEQPDLSPAREITLLNSHSESNVPDVSATVRNNYLNGDFTTGSPPPAEPIKVVTDMGAEIMIQTQWPHTLLDREKVLIAGSAVPAMNDRFDIRWIDESRFVIPKPYFGTVNFWGNATAQRFVPKAMPVTLKRVGTTLVVTTPEAHWRKVGDWVRISGATINHPSPGTLDTRYYNGSFRVSGVLSSTTFTYGLYDMPSAGTLDSLGQAWLDRWPSRINVIPANEGKLGLRGDDDGYAWVQTMTPHFRTPGDYIRISLIGGPDAAIWNGYFKVVDVTNTRLLRCKLNIFHRPPDLSDTVGGYYQQAALRYNFQGITATLPYGARAYGNRLWGLQRGGPYHDLGPGPIRETISYNNYYYDCYIGQQSAIDGSGNNREYWSVAHDNVMELQNFPPGMWNHELPAGIILFGPFPMGADSVNGDYALGHVFLYDNYIRFTNGAPGKHWTHQEYGIALSSVRGALVQENIVTLPLSINALKVTHSESSLLQNNRKNNGTEELL